MERKRPDRYLLGNVFKKPLEINREFKIAMLITWRQAAAKRADIALKLQRLEITNYKKNRNQVMVPEMPFKRGFSGYKLKILATENTEVTEFSLLPLLTPLTYFHKGRKCWKFLKFATGCIRLSWEEWPFQANPKS